MRKVLLLSSMIFILIFICTAFVSAKTTHITLLTVGDEEGQSFGGTADAFLEIKQGSGRIFLDSFPLTKLDTQISTRYANEIACNYLDMDCSGYDFFYTIRAGSTIVGGPSASASLTVLTIAALKNIELNEKVIMTGTINSGGSIGPVGGVIKKAKVAEEKGFEKVLVPMFTIMVPEIVINENVNNTNTTVIYVENETNETIEDSNLTIEIIKVRNIDEAMSYFTDTPLNQEEKEIQVPEQYTSIMKKVSEKLCERAFDLDKKTILTDKDELNKTAQHLQNINTSFEEQDYYSAASYCFTLSVLLRKANLRNIEMNEPSQIPVLFNTTKNAIDKFDQSLELINLTTLSELETYIIVKERLLDAEKTLDEIADNISTDQLGYAIERYYSAMYWSEFFKMKTQKVELDPEYLESACFKKLSEAEERINYAALYVPLTMISARDTLKQSRVFSDQGNYKMCMFMASFAKAEANLLLSTIAISKEQAVELAEEKLNSAKKLISKEADRGFFPIIGYSYYQYSGTLKENEDIVSSLIFSEYSLELSNLEMYFPKKEFRLPRINFNSVYFYGSALLLGLAVGLFIGARSKKSVKKSKNKK
ncbi:MAG: hypothetical protein KKF46_03230 [Nanoarchaeota archaeon]|nr:hypothetical protein [Nanoarchaeota archaeon]MBU1321346.1 hypothetical protein [Nanoarchaeota archaeon]MBU1597269.1 hypothetical protein [Nanoarchaeota archaeon]MBU2441483.1 hypothetical protein [Nanoarchaeota archaeon]